MLTLNKTGAIGSVFLFCHHLWCSFAGDYWPDPPSRTDLCTVIRTIAVSAPLAVAANLAAIGSALFAISYFCFVLWLNLTTVGGVLLVIGIISLF